LGRLPRLRGGPRGDGLARVRRDHDCARSRRARARARHRGRQRGPRRSPRELTGGLALLAEEAPSAEVLWPDNQPIPYSQWGYLQGQRVRYFPTQPPRFVRPGE
jgi:hypothetical protein